jgi:hypothetical protein
MPSAQPRRPTRDCCEAFKSEHESGKRDQTIEELTDFKTQALARRAAQHDEITRLRATLDRIHAVRKLRPVIGSCS